MVLGVLAAGLLAAGCSPYWYKHEDAFTVQPSRLNWVQIYYQAREDAPRMRCDYKNNGVIIVLEGHSVTVGDDFNIEYDKASFGDIRKYVYRTSPEVFRDYLQALVDQGLLVEEEAKEEDALYPKVMVRANIDHHRLNKFTFKEGLIDEIRAQLFQFRLSGLVE